MRIVLRERPVRIMHEGIGISETVMIEPESPVIWITGLPASGKTTISGALESELTKLGLPALHIDSDIIRMGCPHNFGFSVEGRKKQNRYLISLARIAKYASGKKCIIVSSIGPFKEIKYEARKLFAPYYAEVFLNVNRKIRYLRAKENGFYERWMKKESFFEVDQLYESGEPDITLDGTKDPLYYAGLLFTFMEQRGLCQLLEEEADGEPIQDHRLSLKLRLRRQGNSLRLRSTKKRKEKRKAAS